MRAVRGYEGLCHPGKCSEWHVPTVPAVFCPGLDAAVRLFGLVHPRYILSCRVSRVVCCSALGVPSCLPASTRWQASRHAQHREWPVTACIPRHLHSHHHRKSLVCDLQPHSWGLRLVRAAGGAPLNMHPPVRPNIRRGRGCVGTTRQTPLQPPSSLHVQCSTVEQSAGSKVKCTLSAVTQSTTHKRCLHAAVVHNNTTTPHAIIPPGHFPSPSHRRFVVLCALASNVALGDFAPS